MLFCMTADYTPQALAAARENPSNRKEAAGNLVKAAGGKLVEFFHTAAKGPGALVIFDVPDPQMAPAIMSVATSSGTVHNVTLTRLWTVDEVTEIRQKANQIRSSYKGMGQT
jgi:uncharacterized protein with GYD domain